MRTPWQRAETIFCFLVLVAVAIALYSSLRWSQRAGLFPWIVLWPTLALLLWQLFDDVRGKTAPPTTVVGDQGEAAELDIAELTSAEMTRRGLIVVAWILGFFAAIWALGWSIGGAIVTAAYLRVGGRESWPVSIIYAVVVFLAVEILFRNLLNIPFEAGVLFEAVGLDPRLR
jgi:hypothetical protein